MLMEYNILNMRKTSNEEPETAENGEPKIQSVVSYIHKYGYTWRFNSERGSALKLGINGNWLYLLQAFLQRKKEKIVNIVAIVEDPLSKQALRLATSPVDDSPLLEEEEPMVENSANESMHEADLDSETLRLINDPNRQQNTSWHRKGRKINPTTGKTIRKSTRSKPIVKDKVAKGRVTKAKRDPKTTNNGPKKSTTTRENGTAVSKKSATFQKNGTTSSKNSTTSSKNDKASEKNGTTSSKNDEASGKKGAESTKNDKASGKKDTKSSKKVKTGGVASCSKKRGQKRSRDDEDDDAENKRYRNARNSYNLRS
jgi:hypothetical protein